ncbi:MAG TPA: hypothetical protein VGD46_13385 [Rhizobacter sp.]
MRAWLVRDVGGVMQRCHCGLARPVVQQAEGNITIISATRAADVMLPEKGTKTRRCLMAVARSWPAIITTGAVAESAGLQNKETSSLLITLMARGLVERVSERRGLLGGSEWRVTTATRDLLKP